jgi:tripartite-type tricarboxylate transporter receptor subunit TctC
LIVATSSPYKTVEDLVNAIRTNPSSISYGLIGGMGVTDVVIFQFHAALIAKGMDVSKTRPVTYKGSAEVVIALAGGHISYSVAGISTSDPLIRAGKIRPLAVSSSERFKPWPDVPTTTEVGFPSVDMVFWAGLGGPPGLPANIIKILDNAVRKSVSDPDVAAKLSKIGLFPSYQPGDTFRKFVLDEGEAIKALKFK